MVLDRNHYLLRLHAACLEQPRYNAHQILALEHLLGLAQTAESIEAFLARSEDLLELSRATSLDRAANLRDAALEMNDPWLAGAARIEYLRALRATSHASLQEALIAAIAESEPQRRTSTEVAAAIERMFVSLLRLRTRVDASGDTRRAFEDSIETLRRLDPAFVTSDWLNARRYQLRFPWSLEWVRDQLPPHGGPRSNPAEAYPETGFGEETRRWQQGLVRCQLPLPEATPLEMQALPGVGFWQQRQAVWRSPTLARHAKAAQEAIDGAATAIGREAISSLHRMQFEVEAAWNGLLLQTLLAPLAASLHAALSLEPGWMEARSRAIETLYELTGLGPQELLALPAVEAFCAGNLRAPTETCGALHGEAGFEVARLAKEFMALQGEIDLNGFFAEVDLPPAPRSVYSHGSPMPLADYDG